MATLFTYFCDTMSINKQTSHREKEIEMFMSLFERFRKHRMYRKTHDALSRLTTKELRDIGIEKSMITRISLETAYGKDFKGV